MKPRASLTSLACLVGAASPVMASGSSGRTAAIAVARARLADAVVGRDR